MRVRIPDDDRNQLLTDTLTWMPKGCNILHVGAFEFEEAPLYDKLEPKEVVWVDPLPWTKKLFQKLELAPHHRLVPFAAGCHPTTMKLKIAGPQTSLLEPTKVVKRMGGVKRKLTRLDVKVKRLDDMLPDFQPDLIVIDVQGVGDQVLLGAPRLIRRASLVLIEVATGLRTAYEGEATMPSISNTMKEYGFGLWRFFAPYPSDGDALFVKPALIERLARLEKKADEQAAKK